MFRGLKMVDEMNEYLCIKNFGPLENIEIDNIRPLTVFIGESGSGKSSIMKVLTLFRWIYKKICIRSYLKNSGISRSPFRFNFEQLKRNNGFENYFNENTEIVYRRGNNEISYSNGKLNSDVLIRNEELSLDKISYISDKRNVIPELLAKNVSITNSFYLNETWNDFSEAVNSFDNIEIPYLGVRLSKKKVQNGYKFYVEGNENSSFQVGFEDSSSGMQNVAPLITIVDYFEHKYDLVKSFNKAIISILSENDLLSKFKSEQDVGKVNYKNLFFHIEEPELSLFPESQLDLMNQLVQLCFNSEGKIFKTNCMITTHSPYIINYLNLLIKSKTLAFNDVAAYQVIDGCLYDLMLKENNIVDTRLLSEPISNIYAKYNKL